MNITMSGGRTRQEITASIVCFDFIDVMYFDAVFEIQNVIHQRQERMIWSFLAQPRFHDYAMS
jgi:hypothetical protein